MQIGGEEIQKIIVKMVLEEGKKKKKKLRKDTNSKRHLYSHENELNKFQFEIAQSTMMTYGM